MKDPPSRIETAISWAIMGVLVVIAMGVFIKQFDYDPALLIPTVTALQAPDEDPPARPTQSDFSDLMPEDMTPLNPLESFDPDTLSDKIDGKAALYLSAGFLNLRCQRFVRNDVAQSWMEVFVYDMGTHLQAFSVYSAQSRAEAKPLGLTPFSYGTKNALFWVHGRYYVESIASVPSETMVRSMLSFGKNFVLKIPAQEDRIGELALFPAEKQRQDSVALLISDAFGYEDLKNVFTASYDMAGHPLTAFLSNQKSPEGAERLAKAYHAFLLKNGGRNVPLKADLAGARMVEIFDTFELIFHDGPYVAGVHQAEDQEASEKLALMLKGRLTEAVQ